MAQTRRPGSLKNEHLMRKPIEADARRIVEEATAGTAMAVTRFLTGYCHYVYEVKLKDGRVLVARIASKETRHELLGGLYWRKKLEPLGIPLPKMLRAETEGEFAYMVLERLPGCDLGLAYADLSDDQKCVLAAAVVDAQSRCARLPPARGYGYATSYDDPVLTKNRHWRDVLIADLEQSRQRIAAVGVVDVTVVDRVMSSLSKFNDYLSRVRPTAFMDDTTTRNVLVHEGALSGIVDIDTLCFGDVLFTVALTRLALLSLHHDTLYIEHWLNAMDATDEQRTVLNLYTAVFCVNFLGEQGQSVNRDHGTVDHVQIRFLHATLDELLSSI